MKHLFEYLEKDIPKDYLKLYQAWVKEMRSIISLQRFLYFESGSGDYRGLENFSESLLVKALEDAWGLYDNDALMVER
ncbi:MAG: hypothetical protein ACRCU2_13990 [Planktothrix sp.]